MNINKLTLIYFSPSQSSKKILQYIAFATKFNVPSKQIDLVNPLHRGSSYTFGDDELVIVAVPGYGGRLPVVNPSIFESLQGFFTPLIFVGVYGGLDYGDVLLEGRNMLLDRGFICVAAASFVSQHVIATKVGAGRPDAVDIASMRTFGGKIREKIDALEDIHAIGPIDVPGNTPYRELPPPMPITPVADENCIRCMLCRGWCPTRAIAVNNPNETDPGKCIRCHGCIIRCPVKARKIINPKFIEKVAGIESSWDGVRKDPEYFL